MSDNTQKLPKLKRVLRYLLSGFVIYVGITHFTPLDFMRSIMPPYIPYHDFMIYLSGVIEITLGAGLLIKRFRRLAAWGMILLFIAVFPANVYLFQNQEIVPAPYSLHVLRMLLQPVFILWAYWYTRPY